MRVSLVRSLGLNLSIPVLGLERVCPGKGCPWPRIFFVPLASAASFVFSTPHLVVISRYTNKFTVIYQYAMWLQGLREKNFQGVGRSISGPQTLLGPSSLIGGQCH